MLRSYECTVLLRPELSKVEVEKAQSEIIEILTKDGGETNRHEYWGLRSLAYPIEKLSRAHYIFFNAVTQPEAIIEMERQMRIREDILRYMSIKVKNLSEEPTPMMKSNKSSNNSEKSKSKEQKKPSQDKKATA